MSSQLPPDDVTLVASPSDLGLDPEKVEAIFAKASKYVDDGRIFACQLALARHGRLAGFATYGNVVLGGEQHEATNDTLFAAFSITKVAVGAAIWLLIERDQLSVEERVVDIIPEFGTGGKDVITVEQVLVHSGGFPGAEFSPFWWDDRRRRLEGFASWELEWEPGSRYQYHPLSAHWVLAEILERRAGRDFRDFIRSEIIGPMGLHDFHLGLPDDRAPRAAGVRFSSEPIEPPWGWGGVPPDAVLAIDRPDVRKIGIPGAGGFANAATLAMFYQVLLAGGRGLDGRQVLDPETVAYATRLWSQPGHTDPNLGFPVRRGLSIVLAGDDGNNHYRGMGRTVSSRAFGHNGAGGQIAWADPDTGISLGYLSDSFTDYLSEGQRITALSSLAASCLA
ncbi:MAG: serine hydrolase [Dehalococcoidia bacterium]|nr:serine hydrolase [Dehalococcoidia bacterium]